MNIPFEFKMFFTPLKMSFGFFRCAITFLAIHISKMPYFILIFFDNL